MVSHNRPAAAQPMARFRPAAPARLILDWYDRHARALPWRVPPQHRRAGRRPDPYHVWLSEVMLQQTTAATVGPYFREFLARWPTLEALAAARLDEVLHAWQGLGYYARARNLHRCANTVVHRHGGRFPEAEAELRALPGIGPYTAAAIAAIAYDKPVTVVDGNVERVVARLFGVETPLPQAKAELRRLAATLVPAHRAGDFAQAVMDLGATVCTSQKPGCDRCPWRRRCAARAAGTAAELPRRVPRKHRPTRHAVAFWTTRPDGAVLLRRRPDHGLLGGMMEIPSTGWRERPWTLAEALKAAPVAARWRALSGVVRHGFTHFHLELTVLAGRAEDRAAGLWSAPDRLSDQALPTVMKKVIRHAQARS
ncbi:MAG: A/G-specific adenine glycosylase [Kiloniellales bacterium]